MAHHVQDLVMEKLDLGETVYLSTDIEWVEKILDSECGACGSHYKQTHGGWGSICYECQEPWDDKDE